MIGLNRLKKFILSCLISIVVVLAYFNICVVSIHAEVKDANGVVYQVFKDFIIGEQGPILVSIEVTTPDSQPDSHIPAIGQTLQCIATATYSDGTTADITAKAAWETKDIGIATIDENGLAMAKGAGDTYVTAKFNGAAGGTNLSVWYCGLRVHYGGTSDEPTGFDLVAKECSGLPWALVVTKADGGVVEIDPGEGIIAGDILNESVTYAWNQWCNAVLSEGEYSATYFIGGVVQDTVNFKVWSHDSNLVINPGYTDGETTITLSASNSKGSKVYFFINKYIAEEDNWKTISEINTVIDDDLWSYTISRTLEKGTYTAAFSINNLWEAWTVFLSKGKITFISDRDGNDEVYVMYADGSGQTRLTNNQADDWNPCISPDGSKIAFMSDRDGDWEIYIMNVDGSEQTRLTNNPKDDGSPCFSPDGSKIAFESDRDGNDEVYIMNADGSEQTRLTNNQAADWYPFFSPEGSKIVFASERDGDWEIYVMNTDGSGQTRLTDSPAEDWWPCFSPDGSKIAFMSKRDGNSEIYIMNADGSEQTRLTNNQEWDSWPCFSPDGSKIAFGSVRDGNGEIFIMNIEGSNQVNITNSSANEREPYIYFDESEVKVADENENLRSAGRFAPEITRYILTLLDVFRTKRPVFYTNVLLAILTMIPFAVASELFNIILSENEEDLKRKIRKIRPVAYLRRLNEKIEKSMGAKMGRHLIARNIAQMFCVILFYGLAYSLLDPTWKPFSIKGLALLLDMTLVYGIVGIADDIMQWRALKKWKVPAGFSVQPKNLLVSVISISASRLLALVPGMMFGAPVALQVDKSTLGIVKRDKLLKISFITLLVICSGLWSLTLATEFLQELYRSGTLHDVIGGIEGFFLIVFAVTLENIFIQMLGFPGGFGQTMRQKNRWVWFIGLVAVTFVFYLTLINPRYELVEALQETGVILFLSIAVVFIVVAFGLWLHFYFRKKRRLP